MDDNVKNMPDTVIRQEGFRALIDRLGHVGAERFVAIIIREPFDYTKWQKNLFEDIPLEELGAKADAYSRSLD